MKLLGGRFWLRLRRWRPAHLLPDFSECRVAVVAEAEDDGEMGFDTLPAKVAAAEGFGGVHGESGFDGLGAGRVHNLGPGLIVEEPGLGLVDGAAVDDGDR